LIQGAIADQDAPFHVVSLMEEPLLLAVHPHHPLRGARQVEPDDARRFSSPAYPDGIASIGAAALKTRGLCSTPATRNWFDRRDWLSAMKTVRHVAYSTAMFELREPDCQDLALVELREPVRQTVYALMLKELAEEAAVLKLLDQCRQTLKQALQVSRFDLMVL
jgi:DNA-binding transcriptional LysR family regulator